MRKPYFVKECMLSEFSFNKPNQSDELEPEAYLYNIETFHETSHETPHADLSDSAAESKPLMALLNELPTTQTDEPENKYNFLRYPAPYRPTTLPEPPQGASKPDEAAVDVAFLPPLPYPHADILWPEANNHLMEPPAPVMVDFLGAEKLNLLEKQPLADNTNGTQEDSWKTVKLVAREIAETLILTIIIFFLIQSVIRNFRVVGTSMVNNLHDGQYLIIDKLSYSWLFTDILGIGGIQRGDVIVFEPPTNPEDDYVKRVIGLPGEEIEVLSGQVFVDGVPLDEPFEPRPGSYTMPPMTVGENELFVLGDNRNNSNDSHNWGTLPQENIVGRAWVSYWPPDEWGIIPRDRPSVEATLLHFIESLVPSANAETESVE